MRLSEKGITRQKEDILALAERLGVRITRWYEENDTTAFRKKRIRLPNGRSVWRVYRPEFRRMLAGNRSDSAFLDRITKEPVEVDQWQLEKLALVTRKAKAGFATGMSAG